MSDAPDAVRGLVSCGAGAGSARAERGRALTGSGGRPVRPRRPALRRCTDPGGCEPREGVGFAAPHFLRRCEQARILYHSEDPLSGYLPLSVDSCYHTHFGGPCPDALPLSSLRPMHRTALRWQLHWRQVLH